MILSTSFEYDPILPLHQNDLFFSKWSSIFLMKTRLLDFQASSTSMSLTSGGSTGGPGQVAVVVKAFLLVAAALCFS